MCGIIGIVSDSSVTQRILKCLKLLEYRGYDSAGIATLENDKVSVRKKIGKIDNLVKSINAEPIIGNIGIGHTRWATHGKPKIKNTHPMITKNSLVVHNGIIENYQKLKNDLVEAGYQFNSDTDSEVIPNIIDFFQNNGATLTEAALLCAKQLKGAFAICLISRNNPDLIIAIKQNSPLVIGLDKDNKSCYISSDANAISEFCEYVTYLDDGQIGILENNQYRIIDFDGQEVAVKTEKINNIESCELIGFSSFMLKEIYEQPAIMKNIIKMYAHNEIMHLDFSKINHVKIIACGTSMYAGHIAKLWLEEKYDIQVCVEIASEFSAKRNLIIHKDDLFLFISQSGETADTLAALKLVKERYGKTVAIVNSANSSIAKLADELILINSGIEIAVAATKTFIAQLTTLALLSGMNANDLKRAAESISKVLEQDEVIYKIAQKTLVSAQKIICIGRGVGYSIALEGALKIKELTYIPAEGIAAGELKHGSIALVDNKTPIIVIAPEDHNFKKLVSNINEIKARGGKVILIASMKSMKELGGLYDYAVEVPEYGSEIEIPFIYVPVMQLIAHHVSSLIGNDVDKPRNLAKSVTVN